MAAGYINVRQRASCPDRIAHTNSHMCVAMPMLSPKVIEEYIAAMDVPMLTVEGLSRAARRLIPGQGDWDKVGWVGSKVEIYSREAL